MELESIKYNTIESVKIEREKHHQLLEKKVEIISSNRKILEGKVNELKNGISLIDSRIREEKEKQVVEEWNSPRNKYNFKRNRPK
jgi:hypothetical protein